MTNTMNYLHDHKDFKSLILIVSEEKEIDPVLVEKDYWVMHGLYGLQQTGYRFELKGGTSLSKGYQIINRFSEDIDLHIHPPKHLKINENPKNTNPNNVDKRKEFYDLLAHELKIDGFLAVERDVEFDDERYYRSGGIRLYYPSYFTPLPDIKEGILLEVGFDSVTPNTPINISSWALQKAEKMHVPFQSNLAAAVPCYDFRYTFIEKLQTTITKYRIMQETQDVHVNFLRQYYDIYQLLQLEKVQTFLGTPEYLNHKTLRFPRVDIAIPLKDNQALLLEDKKTRSHLHTLYKNSKSLYYAGQPDFDDMINFIAKFLKLL